MNTNKITKTQLILSAHRALLFNILCSVRFIFIDVNDNKLLVSIYADKDFSVDEKDIYYAVSGEISGDFPELDDAISEVRFFVDDSNFEDITNPGILIYARHE